MQLTLTTFSTFSPGPSSPTNITESDLLTIPAGVVTMDGLMLNIKVATLFIKSWLVDGKGCFVLDGRAEDSATAEISRSQVSKDLMIN